MWRVHENCKENPTSKKNTVNIRVPASFVDHDIEVLVSPVDTGEKHYDFSFLAGKLKWAGDILKEQRSLRNEW